MCFPVTARLSRASEHHTQMLVCSYLARCAEKLLLVCSYSCVVTPAHSCPTLTLRPQLCCPSAATLLSLCCQSRDEVCAYGSCVRCMSCLECVSRAPSVHRSAPRTVLKLGARAEAADWANDRRKHAAEAGVALCYSL